MVRETPDRRAEIEIVTGLAEQGVPEGHREADIERAVVVAALDADLVTVHPGAEVASVLFVDRHPGSRVFTQRPPEGAHVLGVHVHVGVVFPLFPDFVEDVLAEGPTERLDGSEGKVHLDFGVVVVAFDLDVEPGRFLGGRREDGKGGREGRERCETQKSFHVHPNERVAPAVPRTAEPPPGAAPRGILGGVKSGRRRSLLYVPGSSERMVAKAATRGADILVLDLEDGVHPSHKDAARERLRESRAAAAAGGAVVALRINPPGGAAGRADLTAAAREGFDAVLIPKAETVQGVAKARQTLREATPFWLMIETALGAANVIELARVPGVEGLVFGSADYRLSMGARPRPNESELDFVRQRILLAARAAGTASWDAPWFTFRDLDGLRRSARRAAEAGFDGKSAVHPGQIPVIHEAFAPTPAERAWAEKVVGAMEDAGARGVAVVELDGELLEELHLRQAKRLLAR